MKVQSGKKLYFRDTTVLKYCYKIGAAVGLFPWSIENGGVFLPLLIFTWLITVGFADIYLTLTSTAKSFKILDITNRSMYLLFNMVNGYSLLRNKHSWKRLFRLLHNLEKTMEVNYITRSNFAWKSLLYIVSYVGLASVIYHNGLQITFFNMVFVTKRFVTVTHIWVMAIFTELTTTILLKKQKTFYEKLIVLYGGNRFGRVKFFQDLRLMKATYRDIFLVADLINKQFGKFMLSFMIIVFLETVLIVHFNLLSTFDDHRQAFDEIVKNFVNISMKFIFVIMLVIAGDLVEKQGEKIIKMTYIINKGFIEDPNTLEQLRNFTLFLENLRGTISIEGYLLLNRNIIPILLSTVATYTIVLIQINLF